MPLTIKKAHLPLLCGKAERPVAPPDIRNARLRKKKQGGIPCRERIRKIFPCLLLGLIYFVKVK